MSPKQGSSPLTRGKRANAHRGFLTVRLIPAHAGKTGGECGHHLVAPAHPRSRGENVVRENLCRNPSGSSPLTRGKPVRVGHAYWWSGLIPAHAGKTSMTDRSPSKHTAHPRSRGENGAWCGRRVFSMGSSPLTRGKLAPPSGRGHHGGLIPAHAGKTTRGRGQSRSGSAHPRSRGENTGKFMKITTDQGSSPLTRGKLPHGNGDSLC